MPGRVRSRELCTAAGKIPTGSGWTRPAARLLQAANSRRLVIRRGYFRITGCGGDVNLSVNCLDRHL